MKIWKVDNYRVSSSEGMEKVLNTYEKQGAIIRQIITYTDNSFGATTTWLDFAVLYTVEDDIEIIKNIKDIIGD